MNFDLNEDEDMLKALAERFVSDRYALEQRRRWQGDEHGFSPENWAMLGALGLIAALFDAESGGLGIGPVAQATVFEALGRGLVVEPLIENVAVAGMLFARLAPETLKRDWMQGLLSGQKRLALAHREPDARRNLARVAMVARHNGSAIYLSGTKSLVPCGHGVDAYLVSARHDGGDVALYLVDAASAGLAIRPWRLIDGSVAVELELRDVAVTAENCLGGGLTAIEESYDHAALLYASEALGIMDKLYADTLEFLRTRKQFGVTLGSFQTLQHRMVTQYAVIEQARGLLNLAMMRDPADAVGWRRAAQGARAFIAEAGVALGHEMIQMHGGMGVTDELWIGHGHKRLMLISRWPEDADAALDRYSGAA